MRKVVVTGWKSLLVFVPAIALCAVLLGPVLCAPAGHSPSEADSDFWLYYHPMAEMAFGLMREGRVPLWNPYLYAGMPLLASIEIGLLYPPNWLHLVLSTDRAFCLLYVFHVLLAAVGTWLYVRGRGRSEAAALFSAMAFAFAAPTLLHLHTGIVTIPYSSAWCPLIFALIDRCLKLRTLRSALPLSLALACQFLAGFPMFTLLLAVLIPAYLLVFGVDWRAILAWKNLKMVGLFGAAAAFALGLVAPQLLPTFDYLGESVRGELSYDQATHLSFPATNLVTFLAPDLFGNNHTCPYWGETSLFDANGFCGATTLLLAIIAGFQSRGREFLFWAITAVLITAVSLGKDSFLYDLCFLFVPGVDRFRGISRLMIFANFALAILAGLGLDQVLAGPNRGTRRLCWIVGGLALAALIGALVQWAGSGANPPSYWKDFFEWVRRPDGEYSTKFTTQTLQQLVQTGFPLALRSIFLQASIVLACCSAILIVVWRRSATHFAGWGLLALLGIELWAFDAQFVVLTDTTPWREIARATKSALPPETEPYRIAGFSADPPLALNRFLYGRLESVGGHENFVLDRYSAFLYKWVGLDPEWQTYLAVPNQRGVYDALNVKYYVCPLGIAWGDPSDTRIQRRVFRHRERDFALYHNLSAWPRVSLVHQAHFSDDLESSGVLLQRLADGRLETDSVVEGDPGLALTPISDADRARERITWVNYVPGRSVIDVECAAPGLLIFIENYATGWRATVDGRPARVVPANVFMIAVPITPGRRRVTLSFESEPFERGCVLAGLSLVAIAGGLVVPWRRGQFRKIGLGRSSR